MSEPSEKNKFQNGFKQIIENFLSAHMHRCAIFAVAKCLFVRPSRFGIMSKRPNLSPKFFYHIIAPLSYSFLQANLRYKIPTLLGA